MRCFSEHDDLGSELHLVGDNVEDQNISFSFSEKLSEQSSAKAAHEDSLALVSQVKGGERKRGRPAGRGIKKVNTAGNQARRARAQIVKKRAKLSEYESPDESDSRDEKRPHEQETDTGEGNLEFHKKHSEPQEETEKGENVQGTETVASSEQNMKEEHETMLVPEIEMKDGHNDDKNTQVVTEKHEIMADDPVQAMLLDMIPSLATNKVEQQQPMNRYYVAEEKAPEVSNSEQPPTTKKKKVSYKDVAGELLKDW